MCVYMFIKYVDKISIHNFVFSIRQKLDIMKRYPTDGAWISTRIMIVFCLFFTSNPLVTIHLCQNPLLLFFTIYIWRSDPTPLLFFVFFAYKTGPLLKFSKVPENSLSNQSDYFSIFANGRSFQN